MKSKIIYSLILGLLFAVPAHAEKIPVKIAPIQVISTNLDEIEVGDWLNFEVVNDVYRDDNLLIKKDSKVIGVVDFVHQNGWGGDGAEIELKTFYVMDVSGKKLTIVSTLVINGDAATANGAKSYLSNAVRRVPVRPFIDTSSHLLINLATLAKPLLFIRGSEIYIEPDTVTFNIFLVETDVHL